MDVVLREIYSDINSTEMCYFNGLNKVVLLIAYANQYM